MMRTRVLAISVMLLAGLAACGVPQSTGSQATSAGADRSPEAPASTETTTAPGDVAGTVTLTESACTFNASDNEILPGEVTLSFANETSDVGAFHIWKLDAGHSFEEFAGFVAEHRRAFDEDLPDTGPPPFARGPIGGEVRADPQAELTLEVERGTYGIACIVPHEGAGRLVATHAAGPLVVRDCSYRTEYQLAYEVPGMDEVEITCDIVYKQVEGVDATLDLYLPPDAAEGELLPTVIYVHGNEAPELQPLEEHWKRYGYRVGKLLAAMGYAVVAFDYRGYMGSTRLEEAYDDVLDLLAYVDANASELHADTQRMCLFGVSGAGMPATWAAIHGEPRPDCVVLLSAGIRPVPSPDVDPLEFVSADMPPFFIGYGALDSYADPDRFVEAATAAGATVIVEEHPGRHGFENEADLDQQRIVEAALGFLHEHLETP